MAKLTVSLTLKQGCRSDRFTSKLIRPTDNSQTAGDFEADPLNLLHQTRSRI
ncbi:hypothetical protein H6G76_22030 [Nostoc sp. FACHB-152]|uniref:hypothetical protein n=1 Tax=unclassified Nostoc TaxID=2593658 RepID=UPI001687B366|nr:MULTISPECIES: hypothetical protein [unclassified Nostoc]MBD2449794.1 hypothetical protein [Nostoc sp. FACHB-152]MBD2471118.1 hypothetical protein [Nostoc sp. FACHB-145]